MFSSLLLLLVSAAVAGIVLPNVGKIAAALKGE
jgi:hypothetical protein